MKEKHVYLWLKSGKFDSLFPLLAEYPNLAASVRPDGIVLLADSGFEDSSKYRELRELAMQESYQDFTAFLVPDSPNFDMEPFLPLIRKVNPGVYGIADIISEVIDLGRTDLKNLLRKYYYSLFGAETIETVLGFIREDQNASRAAAKLYMHRNTLNYRLDHFIAISEIDVRTFRGAVAVFLLFR